MKQCNPRYQIPLDESSGDSGKVELSASLRLPPDLDELDADSSPLSTDAGQVWWRLTFSDTLESVWRLKAARPPAPFILATLNGTVEDRNG